MKNINNKIINNNLLFDTLGKNEEIIYITTKDKFSLIWLFISFAVYAFFVLAAMPYMIYFNTTVEQKIVSGEDICLFAIMAIVFVFFMPIFYKAVNDYFKTDIILTNHRILILSPQKTISLENEEIENIINFSAKGFITTAIRVKGKKKPYKFFLFNGNELKSELSKLTPINPKQLILTKTDVILAGIIIFLFVGYFCSMPFLTNNDTTEKFVADMQSSVKQEWKPNIETKTNLNNIILTFYIEKDGTVSNIEVIQSSGNKDIDNSATEAVKSASPFKRLPKKLQKQAPVKTKFTFSINILSKNENEE